MYGTGEIEKYEAPCLVKNSPLTRRFAEVKSRARRVPHPEVFDITPEEPVTERLLFSRRHSRQSELKQCFKPR